MNANRKGMPELGVAIVVDDNLMFATMVEPALKRLGYQVRTLNGGPSTVEDAARAAPALILVNLDSSRYAGPELVRELRARPQLAGTPLVGYAGHVERHLFQAGRDAGADLVVPNSAIRQSMPEVLAKLQKGVATEAQRAQRDQGREETG
jgi:CheY-like chemotaxis protein